jgi:uncharacterized protein
VQAKFLGIIAICIMGAHFAEDGNAYTSAVVNPRGLRRVSGFRQSLLEEVARAEPRGGFPCVAQVYIPEPQPDPSRDAEFGMIVLEDGSAGLYYAWMGETQRGMTARYGVETLVGRDPVELAMWYTHSDEAERSIALAAINAITASTWRRNRYVPPAPCSSLGIELRAGDHLGMVGYFPPLVRQANKLGFKITVVERKGHMVRSDAMVNITLDPTALRQCNKIVCTAATLINDSLDEVLGYCTHAEEISMVGPTASCFAQPLFARGISFVGGIRILDAALALARLRSGEKLGAAAAKFGVTPFTYPSGP